MTGTLSARAAIAHEFGTHYLADELPHPLDEGLPWWYDGSAARLAAITAPDQRGTLVALLSGMRDNPAHPLVKAIEEDTWFEWTDDAKSWQSFQRLMDALVERLV